MAVKVVAQGTGILLVTANVGSLFEDPENLQKLWLREFYQTVHTHKPHFIALHCQEVGGKNYEASMSHVDLFVKELLSSDAMKEYNRVRVYLDENYKSLEHFTRHESRPQQIVTGAQKEETLPLRFSVFSKQSIDQCGLTAQK
ncbi:inositol polyphosphate-5-phosphatase A-like [Acipenser oxyrinchus oxyrinchus]|uniref:Inositol polyphosphate-5-phosphatase A-like n=1 Tax=Acipenser oxyrinchus oxyrinchus TaxID=40147 RepID=A0AAD8G0T4_ACIOX|nr:inositol polyphosphate-5-phosphatase A-like [Acipenser oxyrinchus oxyrinchus]